MKYFNIIFIIILNIIFLVACKKENSGKIDANKDCFFEQIDENMDGLIDETEKATMNECKQNSLTSKSKIQNNLIGEWELVGHGEGWLPAFSQPCGYLTISKEELIFEFKNADTDRVTTHDWEIEEINSNEGQQFRLNIMPKYVEGLFITQFCSNFMYGNAMPSDGNMYLYEKMK